MDSFKKVLLPIILTMILIVAAGIIYRKNQGLSPIPHDVIKTSVPRETQTVRIENVSIEAEVADSDTERREGLSGRSSLAKDSGMLFVISNNKTTPTFWMKNMKFAIDIIWIKEGRIIQIDKNAQAPAPNTPNKNLKLYSPSSSVDYVLEVNSGYSDLNNIKVGDGVLIE